MVVVGGGRGDKKQRRRGNCCDPESHGDVCLRWRGFEVPRADVTLGAKKSLQCGSFRVEEAFNALVSRRGGRMSDGDGDLY